ncbi:hypothetical protein Y1Q_0007980 [Alligator mississippiensis]|uniref:Uncharacterized protein n=1 Tax=Alligator mississippiensis TaxID=8496 RepID=A0A151NF22_ALLMI|nr:hypothetical protein Y1Q_0007980 [Alligator mississippiensis]
MLVYLTGTEASRASSPTETSPTIPASCGGSSGEDSSRVLVMLPVASKKEDRPWSSTSTAEQEPHRCTILAMKMEPAETRAYSLESSRDYLYESTCQKLHLVAKDRC